MGASVIPTTQMEKQSLGTECSQDHRSPVSGTWEIPSQACLSRGCLLALKRFCPSGSGALKDCTRGNPVRSSPQCGRPKEGTGKPDHWAFAHAQVCSLDCLLACLPMDDPPRPAPATSTPPALRLELSPSAPSLSSALSGLPRPFTWPAFTAPLPRPSAPPACTVMVSLCLSVPGGHPAQGEHFMHG